MLNEIFIYILLFLIAIFFAISIYIQIKNTKNRDDTSTSDGQISAYSFIMQNIESIRSIIENRIDNMDCRNLQNMSELRDIIDDQLNTKLQARLSNIFHEIHNRIESLHKNFGEVRNISSNLSELKKVLYNTKTRGVIGEVQLQAILDDILTKDQYAKNIEIVRHSGQRVEFAIKLPSDDNDTYSYLPIDSKFPFISTHDDAHEKKCDSNIDNDIYYDSIERHRQATKELERTALLEAKKISEKYISPPFSTDFAIMFIPVESLYCDLLRIPDLLQKLNRNYRILIASPTTLSALLFAIKSMFIRTHLAKSSRDILLFFEEMKNDFQSCQEIVRKVHKKFNETDGALSDLDKKLGAITGKLKKITDTTNNID